MTSLEELSGENFEMKTDRTSKIIEIKLLSYVIILLNSQFSIFSVFCFISCFKLLL